MNADLLDHGARLARQAAERQHLTPVTPATLRRVAALAGIRRVPGVPTGAPAVAHDGTEAAA